MFIVFLATEVILPHAKYFFLLRSQLALISSQSYIWRTLRKSFANLAVKEHQILKLL